MAEAFTFDMLAVDTYGYSIREIGQLVETLGGDPFLDTMDDEELADYWASNWMLEPLEWDLSRSEQYDKDEAYDPSGRRVSATKPEPIRRLFMPIVPKKSNPRVLTLRPEKGWIERGPSLRSVAAYIQQEEVILLRGTKSDLSNLRSSAQTVIELINSDIARYYPDLRSTILRMVRARRTKLAHEEKAFEREARELGVEIRRKPDSATPINIRERREVRVLREKPRQRTWPSEPYLMPDSTAKIVDLIDQAGKGFEHARREFRTLVGQYS